MRLLSPPGAPATFEASRSSPSQCRRGGVRPPARLWTSAFPRPAQDNTARAARFGVDYVRLAAAAAGKAIGTVNLDDGKPYSVKAQQPKSVAVGAFQPTLATRPKAYAQIAKCAYLRMVLGNSGCRAVARRSPGPQPHAHRRDRPKLLIRSLRIRYQHRGKATPASGLRANLKAHSW